MNERINQLNREAQAYATRIVGEDEIYFNIWVEMYKVKLAELIVRECMEQINKVEEKGDAHLGGGYFYDGTRLCRDAIKQHFGVEE